MLVPRVRPVLDRRLPCGTVSAKTSLLVCGQVSFVFVNSVAVLVGCKVKPRALSAQPYHFQPWKTGFSTWNTHPSTDGRLFCGERNEKPCFRTFSVPTGTYNKRWKRDSRNDTQCLTSDDFWKICVPISLKIEQRTNFEIEFSGTSRPFSVFSLFFRESTSFN